jgi:hypothetical protein
VRCVSAWRRARIPGCGSCVWFSFTACSKEFDQRVFNYNKRSPALTCLRRPC